MSTPHRISTDHPSITGHPTITGRQPTGTALTGAGILLRSSVRHDGRRFAPWVVLPTVLSASSVLAYPTLFPTLADRAALAAGLGANPALSLVLGPAFDLSTVDGFNAWRTGALGGLMAALGAIFTVTRATRGQEDSGQAELLAAGVLGRPSRLVAAVAQALLGCLLIGVVLAAVTVLCGGAAGPSILLAAGCTATGWMFTAVAAVTAQVGADARTANVLALGVLGVLFLVRGFLYATQAPDWTQWVDPLSWVTSTRPATGDHWLPLLPAVASTAVGLALAFALQGRRDFGQGAIAPRPGPARGAVHGIGHLVLRMNRSPFLVWAAGAIALGAVFGYLTTSITDIVGSDGTFREILAAGATTPAALVAAFLVTVLSLIGIIVAVPGVQAVLRVRAEETGDRLDPVLATSVSRGRYLGGVVLVALAAPTVFLLVAGVLVAVLASGADVGLDVPTVLLQVVATLPAVWLVVAIAVAVLGLLPRVSAAAWLGVVVSLVLTLFGPTLGLSRWVLDLNPFGHVPAVAAGGQTGWSGPLGVLGVAVLLLAAGAIGFGRRDIGR